MMDIWKTCYSWIHVSTVLANSPEEHYWQHIHLLKAKSEQDLWRVAWIAIVWNIWKLRNECIFQQGVFDSQLLLQRILFTT